MNLNKSSLYKYTTWALVLILGFGIISEELFRLNFNAIFATLSQQSFMQLFIYFIFGLLAVSLMSIYDFILRKEFNLNISLIDTFKVAWVSNTVGHFLGEEPTASGGISYLLYQSEGIDAKKATLISIIKNNLFISHDHDDSDMENFKLSVKTRTYLVLGVFTKWLASSVFFVYILRSFGVSISPLKLFMVFILSIGISLMSRIPGGIGIFELVCLYSLSYLNVPIQFSILGILMYRLFYYVIPWVITLFILAIKPKLTAKIKLSASNKRILQLMSVQATAALILFAGLLLIFTSSLPNAPANLEIIENFIPLYTIKVSQFTGMGIGLLLLILSKGIYNKVRSSYYLSLVLLALGALFILIINFNVIEAVLLLLIAITLFSSKEYFYRETRSLSIKFFMLGFISLLSFSLIYLTLYTKFIVTIANSFGSYLDFIFPSISELIIFIVIILLGSLLLNLMSVKKVDFATPTDEDLEKLRHFLDKYPGNSMTHLLFLKDKSLYYAMDGQVLIAFRPYRGHLMALGDPIGDVSLFKEAINEFRIYADRYNMTPVFYEVSEKYLPLYHDNGFNFLKLGEEATMSLLDFTFVGKKSASLRTIKNKMLRNEFEFEMLYPPFDQELIASVKQISDNWLNGRNEKVFSLGSFSEEYINLSPMAIVKKDGDLLGFATIMPMYQEHIFSIDLMRLVPEPPNGTMEAIFIGIIEWGKEQGYTHFVLGKAPLSNVGLNQFSPKKEKIVKHFYNYGNKLYSFKGLRRFKEKFSPEWEGTYLAYTKSVNLSFVIISLARMIAGKNENKK